MTDPPNPNPTLREPTAEEAREEEGGLFSTRMMTPLKRQLTSYRQQLDKVLTSVDVKKEFTFPGQPQQCLDYIIAQRPKLKLALKEGERAHADLERQHDRILSTILGFQDELAKREAWSVMERYNHRDEQHNRPTVDTLIANARGTLSVLARRLEELADQEALCNDALGLTQQRAPSISSDGDDDDISPRRRRIQLPTPKLPEFNGNSARFEFWWDSFAQLVHDNDDLTETEKFTYLIQTVKGDAKKALSGIRQLSRNYGACIALLKRRFGDTYDVKQSLVKSLKQTRVAGRSTNECRGVYDEIAGIVAELVDMDARQGVQLDTSLLQEEVLEKFPTWIREKIVEKRMEIDDWNLTDLLDE